MKSLLIKMFGNYLGKKAELYEGTPEDGKAWWKSKTVLAGIAITLRGLYEGVSQVMVTSGKPPLPPIPPAVDSLLGVVLGGAAIHGRVNASQPIVIDEKLPPTEQKQEKSGI